MRRPALLLLLFVAGAFALAGIEFARESRMRYEEAVASQIRAALLTAELRRAFPGQPHASSAGPATLLFVGDIMLSRGVAYQMKLHYDPRYPFLKIADVIQSADLAFGNLEGPISDRGENQGSEFSFRADPAAVEGLAFAGFDVLSVANNHILDWGREALVGTLELLRRNGISPVGAGENDSRANEPAVRQAKGTSVAFLAYTTLLPSGFEAGANRGGISHFDLESASAKVRELSKEHIVVVSLHWGAEYAPAPDGKQREIARALVRAGADLVLGHHPHVVQEVERYGGGWIAYSIGNFVFDQNFSEETMRGVMLRVRVLGMEVIALDVVPAVISPTFQVRQAGGAE